MNVWFTMLVVGAFTYATRLSFILLFSRTGIPPNLGRALRFVPPAVLSAIIFPELLFPGGQFDLTPGNNRLLAGLIASLVAWRSKNVALTILAGVAVLLLLAAIERL